MTNRSYFRGFFCDFAGVMESDLSRQKLRRAPRKNSVLRGSGLRRSASEKVNFLGHSRALSISFILV